MSQSKLVSFFEQVVTYLLVKAGSHTLPTRLDLLAKHLNVIDIQHRTMAAEGFVEPVKDGYRIALRDDRSRQRTNFSLAHELAHIIIHRLSSCDRAPLSRQYRTVVNVSSKLDDEALADSIAGLILLPPWALSEVIPEEFSMERIVALAKRANCSVATALIRVMWEATQPSIAFHARVYDGDISRMNLLWVRASRSIRGVKLATFLDDLGGDRLRAVLQHHVDEAFIVHEESTAPAGLLELYRRKFDTSTELIYGIWKPHGAPRPTPRSQNEHFGELQTLPSLKGGLNL